LWQPLGSSKAKLPFRTTCRQFCLGVTAIPVAWGFGRCIKNVPHAALRDPALYELLALVDAIRDGRASERNLAERDFGCAG